VTESECRRLLHNRRIEKLIVVDDDGHCIGLITMKDIVRMDAYLVAAPGMDGKMDFAGFNAGFAEFFNNAENPTTTTRTTMQVSALAGPQFLVELTVIAAK
jgi:enamine deaminase RidA (YjgF/YER057c/UK114 family)